ncbi:MAG: hypothetical protein A2534_04375 [Candidatus Magasanikbacteria bacterium RIFOXYD2_FULL_39_9]|uniref:ECF transporter S component n=1 Tax=Candidatus Magasanikbacteria bacterium RIFOXYD1_FULL_40_23 TaxID=1798705 RepID=A0A1F6PBS6_9BACT|nr:MAG: hypothetical protein A2534_04375 [Candidatus Magasanikbacteria bacterium RIFOXYD2_FULL_39_9]OGH93423.1 MAG: hypothetical protein A2563_02335 [Candidatus Magasanikbacteria bacterium RIFOXYD1_FULL_40_23]
MQKYIPAFLLIILGVSTRLLPHPANFAPIAAIALFAGIYLPKKFAIILPLVAMLVSDFLLGFYLWPVMVSVYLSFVITGFIGLGIQKQKKASTILGGTLLASILFFIITNGAVWAFGTMYTHNLNGLLQSYLMALPFFKNTLLGDLFYTGILVGSMEVIQNYTLNKNLVSKLEAPITK